MPLTLGACSLSCAWGQQYIINTYAGNRTQGYAGDSGAAHQRSVGSCPWAWRSIPPAICTSPIRRISASARYPAATITTVAGNGTGGYAGDGAAATSAEMLGPSGVAVDSSGKFVYRRHLQPRHSGSGERSHGTTLASAAHHHHRGHQHRRLCRRRRRGHARGTGLSYRRRRGFVSATCTSPIPAIT